MELINIADFERLARERLSRQAWDYYASGAHDEITLGENRSAYDRLELMYRVLVDVSQRDSAREVLGEKLAMPVLAAPTAFHQLADPEGEVATARAVAGAGSAMILSTLSNVPVEDVVAAANGAPVWFQLYVYRDRGVTRALLERVEAAGCRAVVLTVDAPLLGRRERDVRNRFRLPEGLAIANLTAEGYGRVAGDPADSGLAAYVSQLLDPSLSWKDVEWLRATTGLPVLVKGIVRADDAVRAAEHGAAGVVVSNHGGRQLDTAPATIEVLPEIVAALARAGHEALEVLIDGGVRRGTDVVKALALGARGVLVGRPLLWGLAADGEAGVQRVLELLAAELDLALALCGCPTLADLSPSLVRRRGRGGGR